MRYICIGIRFPTSYHNKAVIAEGVNLYSRLGGSFLFPAGGGRTASRVFPDGKAPVARFPLPRPAARPPPPTNCKNKQINSILCESRRNLALFRRRALRFCPKTGKRRRKNPVEQRAKKLRREKSRAPQRKYISSADKKLFLCGRFCGFSAVFFQTEWKLWKPTAYKQSSFGKASVRAKHTKKGLYDKKRPRIGHK